MSTSNTQDKDALAKDRHAAEVSAIEGNVLAQLSDDDGLTPNGNDPHTEFYYEKELDPARLISKTQYPYLDQVERQRSEVQRAAVEDREPDLENPGPNAGSPLRSFAELANPMNTNVALVLAKAEPVVVIESAKPDEDETVEVGGVEREQGVLATDPNALTPKAGDPDPADSNNSEDNDERNSANGSSGSSNSSSSSGSSSRSGTVKKSAAKKSSN